MQIDVGFFKDVSSQNSGLILWATLYIVLHVYSSFVLVKLLLFLQMLLMNYTADLDKVYTLNYG